MPDIGYPDDNPKTVVGLSKPSLFAIPPSAMIEEGKAMAQGRVEYGVLNWRAKRITFSTYYDALMRHLLALRDGEDIDPKSGAMHLGHIRANAGLMIDAIAHDMMTDDRHVAGQVIEKDPPLPADWMDQISEQMTAPLPTEESVTDLGEFRVSGGMSVPETPIVPTVGSIWRGTKPNGFKVEIRKNDEQNVVVRQVGGHLDVKFIRRWFVRNYVPDWPPEAGSTWLNRDGFRATVSGGTHASKVLYFYDGHLAGRFATEDQWRDMGMVEESKS